MARDRRRRRPHRRRQRARLRRHHRLRLARRHLHPRRAPRGAAARARALARHRHGAAGRARGRAGDDAAAGAHAGDGLLRRAARWWPRRSSPLLNAGLTPVVPRARLARRQRRPRAARPLRAGADRRGRGRPTPTATRAGAAEALAAAGIAPLDADRQGGPRADQRHRRDARDARARPARPRRPAARAPTSPPPCRVEALLGTDRAFAEDLHRAAPAARPGGVSAPTCARCWPARRSWPATARATRACRTPTRCAARRRCTAPRATRVAHARARRRGRARRRRSTTRWCCPDGRVESCGNFHGAPLASPATSSRSPSPTSARSPSGARTGCSTPSRSHGLPPFLTEDAGRATRASCSPSTRRPRWSPRTAASPRPRAWTRCRRARCRRTTCRWAGARRASCASPSRTSPRILAVELVCAGARHRPARAAASPAPGPARRSPRCATRVAGPGPDRFLAPDLAAAEELVATRRRSPAAVEAADRECCDDRTAELRCRGWQQEAALRMLENNLHPDVAEKPEELIVYGGIGKAARDRASYETIRRELHAPRRRRDAARAVGQAGRRVRDARARAARADRQLQPRRPSGRPGSTSASSTRPG